eukprot:958015-Rhodomonas_salina.1
MVRAKDPGVPICGIYGAMISENALDHSCIQAESIPRPSIPGGVWEFRVQREPEGACIEKRGKGSE